MPETPFLASPPPPRLRIHLQIMESGIILRKTGPLNAQAAGNLENTRGLILLIRSHASSPLSPPLPIHRHQKTSETVVCLRGRLVEEYYDELERICTERIELSPNGPLVALNIPAGQWHTARALESGTVIMDVKNGAYEPIGLEDILKL